MGWLVHVSSTKASNPAVVQVPRRMSGGRRDTMKRVSPPAVRDIMGEEDISCVTKPFTKELLLRSLREALDAARGRAAVRVLRAP